MDLENEVCTFCENTYTDSCDDCKVEFEREYKEGYKHTYYIHRNFIEIPQRAWNYGNND